MSNFTKSILYSTTVLAAGLVAIFAIYNNVTQDGAQVAQISPAAGESTIGVQYDGEEAAAAEGLDAVNTASGEETEEEIISEDVTSDVEETAEEAETSLEETPSEETEEVIETTEEAPKE